MSSATGTNAAAAAQAQNASAPQTLGGILANLTVDELNQLKTAITPSVQAVATGDGSGTSLAGAWLSLQGALVGNLSIFQKIAVNGGGNAVLAALDEAIAAAEAKVQQAAGQQQAGAAS